MSQWSEDVVNITCSKIPLSLYSWVCLLNFYKEHKNELSAEDLELIVDKCDEYRIQLNELYELHINECEVEPNVYYHLKELRNKN